ncbi:MFS transporter [Brachybacterium phenoliresistens]|uniref:Multidrug efflux pump Tap n=1 Tax=Brachybacterium phenoliresistens TaxID=396014 RepID=Z9JQG0_9MICO|nr:MFS transporter [Brachybacterium phenoliresistens]EWS80625.1 hypothetical protein BF93_02670 [Brachybacterium phenoliresistens]
MSSRRSPAWSRDFRLHFAARLFSVLGAQCTYVAVPIVSLLLLPPAQAALVTASSYLSTLAVGVPAGMLADRLPRRSIMIGAESVQAAAMLGLVLALAGGSPSLPVLCVLSFVNGSMFAVFGAASAAAVPDLVDRTALTGALSAMQARDAVLGVIAPLLGAALVGVAAWLPFAVAAATFTIATLLLARIGRPLAPPPDAADGAAAAPRRWTHGFRSIIASPVLRGVVAGQMLLSFVLTGTFFTMMAVLAQDRAVLGAGALTALMGLGVLAGSAIARGAAGRLSPRSAVLAQAALWTLCLVALAVSPTLLVMIPAITLMWVIVPTARVSLEAWIADHVPSGRRGRLQSVRGVLNAVASPLGPTACGVLLASGAPVAFAALALAAGIAGVAVLVCGSGRSRRTGAADASAPSPAAAAGAAGGAGGPGPAGPRRGP